MSDQIIIEQVVIGEDSLDDLNKKVNDYITQGYQPKDPMLEIQNTDGNQYHYTQTMARYVPDPNPDDLGPFLVKYIKASGVDVLLDQVDDDTWKKLWKRLEEVFKELMEEQEGPTITP